MKELPILEGFENQLNIMNLAASFSFFEGLYRDFNELKLFEKNSTKSDNHKSPK